MHTLTLTDREVQIIQAALATVSPSGGGSDPFTVLLKVWKLAPVDSDTNLERAFFDNVLEEARNAGFMVDA